MSASHPHLLRLIAVDINLHDGRCSMISELMMNGNIREYIRKNSANRHLLVRCRFGSRRPMFTLSSAQLEEAAAGLCYLHKRGIVHGDLKGVRPSPSTLFRALMVFAAQHFNYQRNASPSLPRRFRAFDPYPWHARGCDYDYHRRYAPLHGPRATMPHGVRQNERPTNTACGYLRLGGSGIRSSHRIPAIL